MITTLSILLKPAWRKYPCKILSGEFVCVFLLWSPRWNSRAISFGDIRTKASVGPGKAVQLSEKAKRAPFQSRLRKKGFFHFGQQQINKTTMHIMMCWMSSAQISILQMPIAKAREPCDSSKPLSAWQQFLHWLHWYHSRVYCFKCWSVRSKMRKIPIVVAVTKAPCEI